MSTTEPPSNPTNPASPRPKKSHNRWARAVEWIVLCVAGLVLFVIVAGEILLHTSSFHNYLLGKAEAEASAMLGTDVHLENFTIHFSNLGLDLYGIRVDGAAPYRNPPLLLVQHVGVGIRVTSILHRKWYLNYVHVDRPVARIFMAADGQSNLPVLHHGGGGHTNVFTLGIRHAVLDGGEVYYNNRKESLEADLHHLEFGSAYASSQEKYSGTVSYRNGQLRFGDFRPIRHNFEARFDATPTSFHLEQAKLTSGQSQIDLVAELKDYSNPNLQAQYHAVFNGGEIGRILRNPSVPAGMVRTSGDIEYQSNSGNPMLDSVTLNGKLDSRQLDIHTSRFAVQVRDIAAHYSLANGNAAVQSFRAHLLGGEVTGTVTMHDITGKSHSRMKVSLQHLSLAELQRIAPASSATKDLRLDGILNADANAAWGKTLADLVAHTDTTLRATVAHVAPSVGRPSVVPVRGVIHGNYTASTKQIALSQSYLRMPQTTLTMNGTVSNRSALAIQLKSTDLSELETVADLFRTPKPGQTMQPLGLAGTVGFQGSVRGSVTTPQITGKLVASNLQLKGTKWRMLRANLEASPSFVSVQNADLEPASRGNIAFDASAQLAKWSFTKSSPVQIELHASKVDISNMEKLAGLNFPVTGTLAVNVKAHGTVTHPMGKGTLSLSHAVVENEPVQSAKLIFTGAGNQVQGELSARVATGDIQGAVSLQPQQKRYAAQLTAHGIQLAKLQAVKTHNMQVEGVLNLEAEGQGTLNNPQLNATLQIPQLTVRRQTMQGVTLKMNVANHVATANLNSNVLNIPIRATAKVDLSGNYVAEATLDSKAISLQPVFAMYAPSQAADFHGETEIHATLRGPLKDKELLAIQATLPTLKLAYGNTIQLAAAAPIQMDYKDGVIDLQRTAIRGTDTNLEIQGSIPISRQAPPSLLVQGTVNLQLAQLLIPNVQSSGQLQFDINSYGAKVGSNVEGQVRIVNANFSNENLPIGLQQGNGVLTLTKDRLNIQQFKATVGSGTLTAQGGIIYRPSVKFDLGAVAKGIRMLYPQGVREEMDADLRLTGSEQNALLGGRVSLQDVSFTPGFDLMSFVSQLSGGVAAPPAQGFSQNLQLNLAVSSSNNIDLASRTLSIDGTANLQVRGTAAQPVILGRIDLNNGDAIFNGNRYTLNGGTVEFINPSETQPVVNLALNTTIQQYNIHLRFNGPADQLRTNYSSDPSLPEADIINLLAFGQTTEAGTVNPTPGDQQAMSLVASQVSSQITSRVAKSAGISQLSINPVLAGGTAQGPAGAIITIQQRVTGNLFVTFSTNITSTQNQVIMGQYKLSPRVSVSATRDQNGGFGFDTSFKKSW